MRSIRVFTGVALVAFSVSLGGCFSSNPEDISAFTKPTPGVLSVENYILQPPDEIEIHCSKVPEVDMQRQQIRPDGIVSFESLGELRAAGKTPEELANLMEEKIILLYALTGDHPVDVRVAAYRSKVYYVLGQVEMRGPQELTGRDTVLEALAKARLTKIAWIGRIQVVRPSMDEGVEPKIFEVNYDQMTAHGDLSSNVLLQEGDIVFVPPTVLGKIGLVLAELFDPIGRAFSNLNPVFGYPTR